MWWPAIRKGPGVNLGKDEDFSVFDQKDVWTMKSWVVKRSRTNPQPLKEKL